VAEGSTGSGSQGDGTSQGSANSGDSVNGQGVATADAPNALNDGVLKKLDLPAIGTTTDATPASSTRPTVLAWTLAAALLGGLALLYRRLPRPSAS
jgi:hypothetical protein